MQITNVRVRRVEAEGRVKAVCTFLIDGVFAVHDVRVVEGQNGLFVSMPSRKNAEGEYRDVAHPITAQAREMIQREVLNAYQQSVLERAGD